MTSSSASSSAPFAARVSSTTTSSAGCRRFVNEAGLALERSRATIALADALERERLISHISLELRSRRNVDEVLPAVLAEIGVAFDAVRCFVRLGEQDDAAVVAAEWDAEGVPPLGDSSLLPVVNLATRLGRTVAVADVLGAPALDDAALGDVHRLSEHGVRAVLATPIIAQERLLGVLALPPRARRRLEPDRDRARGVRRA